MPLENCTISALCSVVSRSKSLVLVRAATGSCDDGGVSVKMRNSILLTASMLLTFSLAGPATAGELEDLTKPNEAEFAAATNMIKPIIDRLIAGDAKVAIDGAFKESPLFDRVKPQLPNLVGQLNTIYEVYGPITKCEPAQRGSVGSLMARFIYLCQHEKFVTKWNFVLLKADKGWVISTFQFSDPE